MILALAQYHFKLKPSRKRINCRNGLESSRLQQRFPSTHTERVGPCLIITYHILMMVSTVYPHIPYDFLWTKVRQNFQHC